MLSLSRCLRACVPPLPVLAMSLIKGTFRRNPRFCLGLSVTHDPKKSEGKKKPHRDKYTHFFGSRFFLVFFLVFFWKQSLKREKKEKKKTLHKYPINSTNNGGRKNRQFFLSPASFFPRKFFYRSSDQKGKERKGKEQNKTEKKTQKATKLTFHFPSLTFYFPWKTLIKVGRSQKCNSKSKFSRRKGKNEKEKKIRIEKIMWGEFDFCGVLA